MGIGENWCLIIPVKSTDKVPQCPGATHTHGPQAPLLSLLSQDLELQSHTSFLINSQKGTEQSSHGAGQVSFVTSCPHYQQEPFFLLPKMQDSTEVAGRGQLWDPVDLSFSHVTPYALETNL